MWVGAPRVLEPDHKLGEMGRRHLFYLQPKLREKTVKPQEPGAIGLDGGWGVLGCRFPIEEALHF